MSYKDAITPIKDTLTGVRELAILVIVLVFAIFPSAFANWAKGFSDAGTKVGAKTEVNVGPLKMSFDNTAQIVAQLESLRSVNARLKRDVEALGTPNSTQTAARAKEAQQHAEVISSTLDAVIRSGKSSLLQQGSELQAAGKVVDPGSPNRGEGQYYVVVESQLDPQKAIESAKRQNAEAYATTNPYSVVVLSTSSSFNGAKTQGTELVRNGRAKEFFVLPKTYITKRLFPL